MPRSTYALSPCSNGSSMLQPIDRPPASLAPRLAASMMPGPPPVMIAKPCLGERRPPGVARRRSSGSRRPMRAEPKMLTAGPTSGEGVEALDELAHDPQHAPRVGVLEVVGRSARAEKLLILGAAGCGVRLAAHHHRSASAFRLFLPAWHWYLSRSTLWGADATVAARRHASCFARVLPAGPRNGMNSIAGPDAASRRTDRRERCWHSARTPLRASAPMTMLRRVFLLALVAVSGIAILAPLSARSAAQLPDAPRDQLLARQPAPRADALRGGVLTARGSIGRRRRRPARRPSSSLDPMPRQPSRCRRPSS